MIPLLVTLVLTVPQAVEVARAKWGAPACGEPLVMDWKSTPDGPSGYVTIDPTTARNEDCVIHADLTWGAMVDGTCDVIVHEWGHLTGHEHSPNPWDIMNGDNLNLFPPCHPQAIRFYVSFKAWDNAQTDDWYPTPAPDLAPRGMT